MFTITLILIRTQKLTKGTSLKTKNFEQKFGGQFGIDVNTIFNTILQKRIINFLPAATVN